MTVSGRPQRSGYEKFWHVINIKYTDVPRSSPTDSRRSSPAYMPTKVPAGIFLIPAKTPENGKDDVR
jgi:hypothetical protein